MIAKISADRRSLREMSRRKRSFRRGHSPQANRAAARKSAREVDRAVPREAEGEEHRKFNPPSRGYGGQGSSESIGMRDERRDEKATPLQPVGRVAPRPPDSFPSPVGVTVGLGISTTTQPLPSGESGRVGTRDPTDLPSSTFGRFDHFLPTHLQ